MKRALLVGINYVGTDHELHGCINDSNNMSVYLSSIGFDLIHQILEADATTEGIIKGLMWLTSGNQPGDVIVFHYSGHGSQMPRATAPTTFEEIICPIDLDWMTKIITDDTLRNLFNQVPNGVNTTVILDCCHSGTMLEQVGAFIPTAESVIMAPSSKNIVRFLPPPPGKIMESITPAVWNTSKDINASALLIAGCGVNETSADTVLNGQPCGAATAALLKAVGSNSGISYKNLTIMMNQFMTTNKYSQTPELDGDSSLYEQKFLQPWSFTITEGSAMSTKPVNAPKPPSIAKIVLIFMAVISILTVIFLHH